MTPERFQQIEELYHAVREKTEQEREALLLQTDPEMRREIESLLAQRSGGEFLDRHAIENAPQLLEVLGPTEVAVNANLGPYRLEGKLGAGGMGEVFRAVDTRLGRAVAIKTAREQFSDRAEIRRHRETFVFLLFQLAGGDQIETGVIEDVSHPVA